MGQQTISRKSKWFIIGIVFLIIGVFAVSDRSLFKKSPSQSTTKEFSCKNCNVILISIDTFGAKHLGLYGNPHSPSPLLDKYALEKGIVFHNAIVQAPWTLPSHTAMLTGQYPAELGMWIPQDGLPVRAKTIAQALSDKGLRTKAISYGAFVQPEWGFDKGFKEFSGSVAIKDWNDSPKIFRDGMSWMKQNNDKQFFLFLHSFHIHDPYMPSEKALSYVGKQKGIEVHISDIVEANTRPGGPTKEDAELFETAYHGEIWDLDQALSDFFKNFESSGLSKNTVVIVTADHGEEFGEHGTVGFHVSPYGETIRVPLIIFMPNNVGQRIDKVVEIRSIPATIMDLLGLPNEPSFKGKKLFPIEALDGIALSVSGQPRDAVFGMVEKAYENIGEFGKTIIPKERTNEWENPYTASARSNNWHLIKGFDGSFQLYNLKKDPEEKNNVFSAWQDLENEERREALKVIKALSVDVPVPCGIYCINSPK